MGITKNNLEIFNASGQNVIGWENFISSFAEKYFHTLMTLLSITKFLFFLLEIRKLFLPFQVIKFLCEELLKKSSNDYLSILTTNSLQDFLSLSKYHSQLWNDYQKEVAIFRNVQQWWQQPALCTNVLLNKILLKNIANDFLSSFQAWILKKSISKMKVCYNTVQIVAGL